MLESNNTWVDETHSDDFVNSFNDTVPIWQIAMLNM